MKQKLILFFFFAIPLCCMAQRGLAYSYDYDAAGNRVRRKTISLPDMLPPPPTMPDTTETELAPEPNLMSFMSVESSPSLESSPPPMSVKSLESLKSLSEEPAPNFGFCNTCAISSIFAAVIINSYFLQTC